MCLLESQDICLVETQDMCCVESCRAPPKLFAPKLKFSFPIDNDVVAENAKGFAPKLKLSLLGDNGFVAQKLPEIKKKHCTRAKLETTMMECCSKIILYRNYGRKPVQQWSQKYGFLLGVS